MSEKRRTEEEIGYEHPAFTRAKDLPEPWRGHFPKTVKEAGSWRATTRHRALATYVIAAARTRIECAWSAYIDSVPGYDHGEEFRDVLNHGSKLPEDIARAIFPEFEGVPYSR